MVLNVFFFYCSPGLAEDDKWENGGRGPECPAQQLECCPAGEQASLQAPAARDQSCHLLSADPVPGSGISTLFASPRVTVLTAL